MGQPFTLIAGDRLQIREGGGCMSVFGRSWTTIDRAQREVSKQWGLIVPLRERAFSLDGFSAIRLDFVQGDSDTADQFPIALKAHAAPDLRLCSFTAYAPARECARAVAEHLRLEVEDATTDHPVRLSATQIDVPLQKRPPREEGPQPDVDRPPGARSQVSREIGTVTIVIPTRPLQGRVLGLVLAAGIIPITIALTIGPSLVRFFRDTRTPGPVAWVFLGFLTLLFGVVPTMTIVNGFLRSRRGATIVEASKQGLRISERGAWRTRTRASIAAADILDVDYSSHESTVASAKRAAEQQVLQSHPSADTTVSPRVERMLSSLARFGKGKGVTVKARTGLTTFGSGLDDAEIRYLHSAVRRALVE